MWKTKIKGIEKTGTYPELVKIINATGLLGGKIERV